MSIVASVPTLCSTAASDDPPRLPRQVWVAEDAQCPFDPEQPWGFPDQEPYQLIVHGNIAVPVATHQPMPRLDGSKELDLSSIVIVQTIINRSGRIERIGVLLGSGDIETVITTLQDWRFGPGKLHGEAVCVVGVFRIGHV